jgi:hypothetical protein
MASKMALLAAAAARRASDLAVGDIKAAKALLATVELVPPSRCSPMFDRNEDSFFDALASKPVEASSAMLERVASPVRISTSPSHSPSPLTLKEDDGEDEQQQEQQEQQQEQEEQQQEQEEQQQEQEEQEEQHQAIKANRQTNSSLHKKQQKKQEEMMAELDRRRAARVRRRQESLNRTGRSQLCPPPRPTSSHLTSSSRSYTSSSNGSMRSGYVSDGDSCILGQNSSSIMISSELQQLLAEEEDDDCDSAISCQAEQAEVRIVSMCCCGVLVASNRVPAMHLRLAVLRSRFLRLTH